MNKLNLGGDENVVIGKKGKRQMLVAQMANEATQEHNQKKKDMVDQAMEVSIFKS